MTSLKIPATEIIDKLKKYVDSAVEKMVYKNATILDPRIKAKFFKNQRNWKQIRDSFKYQAECFNQHAEEITQSSDDDGTDWTNQIFERRKISDISAEIKEYLQEDAVSRHDCPISYWKCKIKTYPSLATMAKTFLAVPSTNVPSERAFSKGRPILHHTRSSMSPEKLRALMCLSDWCHHNLI